jgi:hypothetical protein
VSEQPSDDDVPVDLDRTRPFTRAQAKTAGLKAKDVRVADVRRLHRGVYIAADVELTNVHRIQAALSIFEATAFASHASAARLWGLPIPTLADEHVSVPKSELRRNRPGIRCHLHRSPDVQVRQRLRVSTPPQLFIEMASIIGLVDLVVLGDAMVKRKLATPAGLIEYCENSGMRGARVALRAARYVRERVDSPMESRLRMLLVLAGLPEPEVNLTLRDVDGEPLRRFDLSWPAVKVIVEYDGRHHIEREEQWEADLDRREAIDDDGWRILVVIAKGIYTSPEQTVRRVWKVLRQRGLSGLPARPSDDWRPPFPGRD